MQHIIDCRQGIMNTNSKYYQYFENKKHTAKELVKLILRKCLRG